MIQSKHKRPSPKTFSCAAHFSVILIFLSLAVSGFSLLFHTAQKQCECTKHFTAAEVLVPVFQFYYFSLGRVFQHWLWPRALIYDFQRINSRIWVSHSWCVFRWMNLLSALFQPTIFIVASLHLFGCSLCNRLFYWGRCRLFVLFALCLWCLCRHWWWALLIQFADRFLHKRIKHAYLYPFHLILCFNSIAT